MTPSDSLPFPSASQQNSSGTYLSLIPTSDEMSIKSARSEWKLKTPLQKWCYLYGIGRAAFGLIRMSLLNDVHRTHWFGYFTMVYATLLPLLSLYSIIYYAYEGKLQMAFPSTIGGFICIGVCETWFEFLSKLYNCAHSATRGY